MSARRPTDTMASSPRASWPSSGRLTSRHVDAANIASSTPTAHAAYSTGGTLPSRDRRLRRGHSTGATWVGRSVSLSPTLPIQQRAVRRGSISVKTGNVLWAVAVICAVVLLFAPMTPRTIWLPAARSAGAGQVTEGVGSPSPPSWEWWRWVPSFSASGQSRAAQPPWPARPLLSQRLEWAAIGPTFDTA